MSDTTMRPVDFRPITQDGWLAHYISENGEYWTRPIAGWLVCDEHEHDAELDLIATPAGYVPHRYVYAAVCDEGRVEVANDSEWFWYVTGPGERWANPTTKEIADEVHARKERARRRAQRRAENPANARPERSPS